jgi:NAD(P)-dependent dehydrogenase (short-subunit alcohol dehydrogenase family)
VAGADGRRIALMSGANRGIGCEFARELAEDHGFPSPEAPLL